jgi:leucyl aminopeptidase
MNSLFLSLLVLFTVVYGAERLIQFNETYTLWIDESEIEKLSWDPNLLFMDITDYPNGLGDNINKQKFTIPITPTHQTVVNPLLSQVDPFNLNAEIGALSSYTTRYYTSDTGAQAVNYFAEQYRFYAGSTSYIQVNLFPHSWLQPSLIARIVGTTNPNEIIILGGHIDSTSNGATAPGADDDASGSSTVLEVFRVLTSQGFRGERTIEFHAYAAEEAGLLGSQAIANNYANAGRNVVAMLQFDMTGYIRAGTTPTIGVVTDYTATDLSSFVRALVSEYVRTPSFTNTQCGYACSDHASWYRAGYTDAFVFESTFANSNPYIHSPNDLLNRLDSNHCAAFAKLGVAYAVELSYAE